MTTSGDVVPETGHDVVDEPDLPDRRRAPGVKPRVVTVLALLIAPVAVFVGLRVISFYVQNGADPFIYLGYQESLGDLVERFGYTYYFPVRFGLLLPLQLASWAFGAVPGFYVSRYVLALLAAVALYALGRAHGSRAAGWVGAVACLCSPVFLGALMTLYADTVAIPCLIAGIALLLLPADRARPWRAATAGVLFGIAFNTNLFVGPLLVAAFGCRAILHVLRREWYAFIDWLVVAVAVVGVTALGAVYYGLAFGDPDILTPSIDAARLYSGETGLVFRSPSRAWLTFSPHLYIPALVGLALLLVVVLRRPVPDESWVRRLVRPGAADALALLGGAQLFFGIHQFLLDGYSMEAYYYYSFMWPFAMIALVIVMVELAGERTFGTRGVWIAASLPVLITLVLDLWLTDLELWPSSAVPVLAAAVVVGLLAARLVPWTVWVAGLAVVAGVSLLAAAPPRDVPLSPGQAFRWDPHYENLTGGDDDLGISYYRAAAELSDLVPTWEEDPGSTVYWYRNTSIALNHVQASRLWRDSTIDLGGSDYPTLRAEDVTMLTGRTPRHVVVLGETVRDRERGERSLAEVITPLSTRYATIGDDRVPVHVAILTYEASSCDQDWRERGGWATQGVCP